jgi:HTH-type transcriptional regulator, sugar sensing transcriptional regulator
MKEGAIADDLVGLGLTQYEAKAYVALVRRDSSTAAEAARLAGVPRQRIYDVLASLAEKGLAASRPGDVVKYTAIAPDQAIGRLVESQREAFARAEAMAAAALAELTPAYIAGQKESDPLEYIEVLRDRGAINERFNELQQGIQREILVFTKPPYATPAQENVEGLQVAQAHVARSVYELSAFDDEEFITGVEGFLAAGEEARFVQHLPLKLVIIDESIVLFGMEDPVAGSADLTLLVIEHPALAQVLKIAFGAVWANGLTFEQARRYVTFERARQQLGAQGSRAA